MSENISERVSFRLRKDQLDYVKKLEKQKGAAKSAVLRDIVSTHRAIMESSLSQLLKGAPIADVTAGIPDSDEEDNSGS